MHKITDTKISNSTLDKFSFFSQNIIEKGITNSRIRGMEYTLLNILKLLDCLSTGERSFGNFYLYSGFGHKRGFLNYLNLCMKLKFIEKERVGMWVFYRLTDKGNILLDLFKY